MKLKGWKTVLAGLAVALLGYAATLNMIDVRAFVELFVSDKKVVGVIMMGLGFLFAALRFFTTTAVFSGGDDDGAPPA